METSDRDYVELQPLSEFPEGRFCVRLVRGEAKREILILVRESRHTHKKILDALLVLYGDNSNVPNLLLTVSKNHSNVFSPFLCVC